MFMEEYPQTLNSIRRAALNGEMDDFKIACHSLKGSIATFAASSATRAIIRLESLKDMERFEEPMATLETELRSLLDALVDMVAVLCQKEEEGKLAEE